MRNLKWALAVALLFGSSAFAAPSRNWAAEVNVRPILHFHLFAQIGGHTAALTWTLSTDDTTANCAAPSICTQNVYRIAGTCPVPFTTTGAALASVGSTATTFTDSSPLFGNSCYAVTFIVNSSESAFSNGAGGSLRPAAPTAATDVEK